MALVTLALAVAISATGPVDYLVKGERALANNQYRAAIRNFDAALGTGMLNTTGKSMAYWNLHYCYIRVNDLDNAAESILGFIVHSLDYLDFIEGLSKENRKNHPGVLWLRRFKVRKKLDFASKRISAYWEFRNNGK